MASAIECIIKCCKNKGNFVLNGGAGSGKTYTLGQTLDHVYNESPKVKVACITYTNVAKNEINERFSQYGTIAYTIHEFLWEQIKMFQQDLKTTLIKLVTDKTIKYNKDGDKPPITDILNSDIKINYQDYKKLEDGVFSHDDLLKIAEYMFANYSLLSRIIADRYDYIFINEYQDTNKLTIKIFLEHIQSHPNKPIIGLFGDSMQAIYQTGIGDINSYIENGVVTNIPKEDNYRCSVSVINAINQLRLDDLTQQPAGDNLQGSTTFLYSTNGLLSKDILSHSIFSDWNLDSSKLTKILYLTHRLIATEMGFPDLFVLYNKKLTEDSLPKSVDHLLKLQEIIELYNNDSVKGFLQKSKFIISLASDKTVLKTYMDYLNSPNITIGEWINHAHTNNIIHRDEAFLEYINQDDSHKEKYNTLSQIQTEEIRKYYDYQNATAIFSTQHSIKGAEFDNVLVIMDNGNWNLYNFNYLFEKETDKKSVVDRTQKLFYVACSRAKNNLVVYFENPSQEVLTQVNQWFENVVNI
ncbi:MAG: UvrD-helicase domain-containing protein [Brevinemataceae bacterium]